MWSHKSVVLLLAAALALALGGCGEPSSTTTSSTSSRTIHIAFASPAVHHDALPALYTCDGRDISPPVVWGQVPATVEELAVFAVELPSGSSVAWAMAGVAPALHRLGAGEVPRGAYLLQTNSGRKQYSICPPRGREAGYAFAILALPPGVRATPRITGAALLHNLIDVPGHHAPAGGGFAAGYKRT